MSKKFIIILIAVCVLILFAFGYYFLSKNSADNGNNNPSVFRNFFPFGGATQPTPIQVTPEKPMEVPHPAEENYNKKLRKLSTVPVSGAGTMDTKNGTVVRYIEKATGHIYEIELFSPKKDRISNTTIPLPYDAIWGNANKSLIVRYLKEDNKTVDTYSLTLKNTATTTENTISGTAFPAGIDDVSIAGNIVFYLVPNQNGSTGYTSNIDGSKKKQIWSSPIRELLSQFVNSTTVALTTKPDSNSDGFLYTVNTGTGQVKKIMGNIPELSTLMSSDGAKVLYTSNGEGMTVYNVSDRTSVTINPGTFPEKCIWSKKTKTILYCAVPKETLASNALISWYMGTMQFTDDIWKYDTKANKSIIVDNLYEDSGENIDVIKPILSENEQYLVFINKRDGNLWSLDLSK